MAFIVDSDIDGLDCLPFVVVLNVYERTTQSRKTTLDSPDRDG